MNSDEREKYLSLNRGTVVWSIEDHFYDHNNIITFTVDELNCLRSTCLESCDEEVDISKIHMLFENQFFHYYNLKIYEAKTFKDLIPVATNVMYCEKFLKDYDNSMSDEDDDKIDLLEDNILDCIRDKIKYKYGGRYHKYDFDVILPVFRYYRLRDIKRLLRQLTLAGSMIKYWRNKRMQYLESDSESDSDSDSD